MEVCLCECVNDLHHSLFQTRKQRRDLDSAAEQVGLPRPAYEHKQIGLHFALEK